MRRSLGAAGAAVATLCLSLLAPIPAAQSADPAHVPVWDKGPEGERYVAMGDSFVAGYGLPTRSGNPGGCARSEQNFPTLVATALDVQSFIDASCSGATTEHFWAAQNAGANPPQLDAVTEDTTLVTFGTMGGNDVGLVGVATTCALSLCAGTPDDAVHLMIEETRDNLVAGIQAVKDRAPEAVIAVVGYGTYLPVGGCSLLGGMAVIEPGEAEYLQGLIDHLSDVLEEVAAAEGVAFVDMRDIPGAVDHTACAVEPTVPWINPATLHPTAAGMAAMAGQVLGVVEEAWTDSPLHPIPFPPRIVPLPEPEPEQQPTQGPSPTTTPTAAPAAPAPVSQETLLAQAEAALDRVVFKPTCYTSKGHRVVRFKARRGRGMIERVVFRIGPKKIGTDRAAPFVVQRRAGKMARLDGRVKARVTVRNGEVTASRVFRARRAGCLR